MVNGLNKVDLKEFLDEKYQEYNNVNFIEQDPIQIPHLYRTFKPTLPRLQPTWRPTARS